MALSIQRYCAPVWPLGAIVVPTPGTPVNIMFLVDPGNSNAPETAVGPGTVLGAAYAPTCHKIFLQGVHPGANNNGMVINTGNVYLTVAPAGNGTGGRVDSGSIVFTIFPGAAVTWPGSEVDRNSISPYKFWIDSDSANDGALVSLQVG